MGSTCRVLIYFGNVGCCMDFECFGDESGIRMEVKIRMTSAKVKKKTLFESYIRNTPY